MSDQSPVGMYGSLASGGGALYATAAALRGLATDLRQGGSGVVDLDTPPAGQIEVAPIRQLAFAVSLSDEPVAIGRQGDVLLLEGGSQSMSKLAQTFENLSVSTEQLGECVAPHVDLEYFPGHGFLGGSSLWLTLILVEGA